MDYKKYFEKKFEIFEEYNVSQLIIIAPNMDDTFSGEKTYNFKDLYIKLKVF